MAKDFPRNGPSGWYSQAWMSRALQSLRSTTPKTWSATAEAGTVVPISLALSHHEADLELDVEPLGGAGHDAGRRAAGADPAGLVTGVPLTTIVPARPWYPTGR